MESGLFNKTKNKNYVLISFYSLSILLSLFLISTSLVHADNKPTANIDAISEKSFNVSAVMLLLCITFQLRYLNFNMSNLTE